MPAHFAAFVFVKRRRGALRLSRLMSRLMLGLCGTLLLLEWLAPSVALGQPVLALEVDPAERLRVALLPDRVPLYLYPGTEIAGGVDAQLVRQGIARALRRQPYFELLSVEAVQSALRGGSVQVAQSLVDAATDFGYGQAHFFDLNMGAAIETLSRVVRDYDEGLGEWVVRDEFAMAYQYLAYAYIERSATEGVAESEDILLARQAFQGMVRLAPHIVLYADRQPMERVRVYEEARANFLASSALRMTAIEKARKAALLLDVDLLLVPRVVQDARGVLFVEIDVYDRGSDSLESSEALWAEAGAELSLGLVAAAEAYVSRLAACAHPRTLPPRAAEAGQAGRFYLDTGFGYFVFLEAPTSYAFDNIGAFFRATYMATEHFFVTGYFGLAFSGNDREGDLLATFNTFRGALSVGVSMDFDWIRPFFSSGLEVASTTGFSVTHATVCKTYGVNDRECPPSAVQGYAPASSVGLSSSLGVNVGLDPVFFVAGATFSFSVFPLDSGTALNFPVGFDVGVQYRF